MREFNYEEAHAGAAVCTRNGLNVQIISWKNPHDIIYPIRAIITLNKSYYNKTIICDYTKQGQCIHMYDKPDDMDLMMKE